jgi:hypothetical protein
MEELQSSLEGIVSSILNCDPSIYRLIITDQQGLEIANYVKHWAKKPGEEKSKNPIYPLLNTISINSEKFMGFLRITKTSPFIFTWEFEKVIIFAATSPFGFVGVFCETDVNRGMVKKVLKENTKRYNQIIGNVFKE